MTMTSNRLIIIALLLSVALNLVFVGGIAYRANTVRETRTRPLPPNIGWLVRDLSEERRVELGPILSQSYDEIGPLRRSMTDAQRRINELMAAESYNPDALAQAFADLRQASDRYQVLSHEQTVALLAELTAEERQAARAFVQRRGPRDGFRRGNQGGPGFGPDGRRGPGGRPPPRTPDQEPQQ